MPHQWSGTRLFLNQYVIVTKLVGEGRRTAAMSDHQRPAAEGKSQNREGYEEGDKQR